MREGGGTLNYATDLWQQIRACVIYSVWKKEATRYLPCHIFQVEENNSVLDFYFNMSGTLLPQYNQATLHTKSDICMYTGMFKMMQGLLKVCSFWVFINACIIC